jgi:hypothetical protein
VSADEGDKLSSYGTLLREKHNEVRGGSVHVWEQAFDVCDAGVRAANQGLDFGAEGARGRVMVATEAANWIMSVAPTVESMA